MGTERCSCIAEAVAVGHYISRERSGRHRWRERNLHFTRTNSANRIYGNGANGRSGYRGFGAAREAAEAKRFSRDPQRPRLGPFSADANGGSTQIIKCAIEQTIDSLCSFEKSQSAQA